EEDTANVGVQVIILVEDNVRFYSSYLPLIYTEIFNQAKRLISEGINLSDKYLRMRARPKILLCTTYEDAWYNFEKYKDYVLGIISDIDFMRDGKQDPEAGIEFARAVKKRQHDIPILLQSNSLSKEQLAYQVNASFLLKNSLTLLNDLRKFMIDNFGFGDFVFKS
ncbi:MAG: histidine kinase, partial [Calditrichaeota bacterium]|nr:histidine kinase [Calditrichota bacterium]